LCHASLPHRHPDGGGVVLRRGLEHGGAAPHLLDRPIKLSPVPGSVPDDGKLPEQLLRRLCSVRVSCPHPVADVQRRGGGEDWAIEGTWTFVTPVMV